MASLLATTRRAADWDHDHDHDGADGSPATEAQASTLVLFNDGLFEQTLLYVAGLTFLPELVCRTFRDFVATGRGLPRVIRPGYSFSAHRM